MPKSKRDKKVSLTKTKKKGLLAKQALIEDIKTNLAKYSNIYVFSVENMRNVHLKEVRSQWKSSRFFFGKSKVMALALGKTEDTEEAKNLHKLTAHVAGQCGLLFTNEPRESVLKWFEEYVEMEFARSGSVMRQDVVLNEGKCPEELDQAALEPELRRLGLATEIVNGHVHLREDYVVCEAGQVLTPNNAQILKLLRMPLAEFRIKLIAVWLKDHSDVEIFGFKKMDED